METGKSRTFDQALRHIVSLEFFDNRCLFYWSLNLLLDKISDLLDFFVAFLIIFLISSKLIQKCLGKEKKITKMINSLFLVQYKPKQHRKLKNAKFIGSFFFNFLHSQKFLLKLSILMEKLFLCVESPIIITKQNNNRNC